MTPNAALDALRTQAPLVHCMTNYVAMNIAANVMLAAGASPAMIHAEEEVADFTPICGALTINIGTLSPPWLTAMLKAAGSANTASVPWVLDPVAHFATPYRGDAARQLLGFKPTILRGNASEIMALSGAGGAGKGADSGDEVAAAKDSAITLATTHGCVVAITGPVDFVTDGTRQAEITGGDAMMPKITALGCALTALTGAYAAVTPPLEATVAALTHFAEAGEQAGKVASGPGSFSLHFLDHLHLIQPGDLDEGRVTWS
ncbi:hydroxyethylthiazole kinase [Tateyamaria omphalii]|uniref:Hydroxyethylthiazole kinase n=1 Tax=Tateyamaria omphalii TaxID=299262 RepID=A0A1P8N0A9_9RHOB|nr:hydroxyethylthiazole kinase [Tateyamaria omphalii]APX13589.1 hydroxyethylthiazole kinase [Tateyamaria omphalii]